jgi:hypothetical protein
MFVLPVGLSVITNDPVGVGNWGTPGVSGGNFSVQRVVESLEQTILQVHVSDRVDAFWECDTSWHLSVSMSPVVLDTLHMMLVDDNDNFLMLRLINLRENIIISVIDKDLLEFRQENTH